MKRNIHLPTVLGFFVVLVCLTSCGEEPPGSRALTGMNQAKVYFDVNVGHPAKLLSRLDIINRTRDSLLEMGVTPEFIIGFRSTASNFVTKGDDYVFEEELEDKRKVHEWLRRFAELGITMEQCRIAAGFQGIDSSDFRPEIELVPNGYISMIGYQLKGYAQIPMD